MITIRNILGFFPFGYLFLSLLNIDKGKRVNGYLIVLLSGFVLSLLIETVQYYLPGRTSSLNDLAANGIGGFIGILYYNIESRVR